MTEELRKIMAEMGMDVDGGGAEDLQQLRAKDGVVLWWNIGPATKPEPLLDLSKKWFSQRRFKPNLREWGDCLKHALRVKYPSSDYKLHGCKLDKSNSELASYEVQHVDKAIRGNYYKVIAQAYIKEDAGTANYQVHFGPPGGPKTVDTDLTVAVQQLRKTLAAQQVGEWLIDVLLTPEVGCMRLTLGGRNMFCPLPMLPRVKELKDVLEQAADKTVCRTAVNRLTVVQMPMNADVYADITDSVLHHTQQSLDAITNKSQNVGKRGLRTQLQESERLLRHLEKYQDILERVQLDKVKADIQTVREHIGVELARAEGKQQEASGQAKALEDLLGV